LLAIGVRSILADFWTALRSSCRCLDELGSNIDGFLRGSLVVVDSLVALVSATLRSSRDSLGGYVRGGRRHELRDEILDSSD
jgi:hypothetical protein